MRSRRLRPWRARRRRRRARPSCRRPACRACRARGAPRGRRPAAPPTRAARTPCAAASGLGAGAPSRPAELGGRERADVVPGDRAAELVAVDPVERVDEVLRIAGRAVQLDGAERHVVEAAVAGVGVFGQAAARGRRPATRPRTTRTAAVMSTSRRAGSGSTCAASASAAAVRPPESQPIPVSACRCETAGDGRHVVLRGVEAARGIAVVVGDDLAHLRHEDVRAPGAPSAASGRPRRRRRAGPARRRGSRRAATSSATTANAVVWVNLSVSPASIQPPVRSTRWPSSDPPTTVASFRCEGPCAGEGSKPSELTAKKRRMCRTAALVAEPSATTTHGCGARTRPATIWYVPGVDDRAQVGDAGVAPRLRAPRARASVPSSTTAPEASVTVKARPGRRTLGEDDRALGVVREARPPVRMVAGAPPAGEAARAAIAASINGSREVLLCMPASSRAPGHRRATENCRGGGIGCDARVRCARGGRPALAQRGDRLAAGRGHGADGPRPHPHVRRAVRGPAHRRPGALLHALDDPLLRARVRPARRHRGIPARTAPALDAGARPPTC